MTLALKCFSEDSLIPVLIDGEETRGLFGNVSEDCGTWKGETKLPITIKYEGFEGNNYTSDMDLVVKNPKVFSSYWWEPKKKDKLL
ncbi:MAG: hypothetical protein ACFCBU_09040 [Cyanophyceae cyanobacterium]